jgi:hypothetical protein
MQRVGWSGIAAGVAAVAVGTGLALSAASATAQTTGDSTTTTGGGVTGQTAPPPPQCVVEATGSAKTITPGNVTWRGAISQANAGVCGDGAGNQVVSVTPGLGLITSNALQATYGFAAPLIINGNGATVSGGNNNRLFLGQTASLVTLNNLTFTNGLGASRGGAVNAEGPLTLNNDSFTNNTGQDGGGAVSDDGGPVVVNNSTFSANTGVNGGNSNGGDGGAIRVHGAGHNLTVTGSTFTGNQAQDGDGGAIWVDFPSTTTITGSTFMSNQATAGPDGSGDGGAVFAAAPVADSSQASPASVSQTIGVTGSTFSQNTGTLGGAIDEPDGTLTLTNSSVTANTASSEGGGVAGLTVQLAYTDVVSNTAPQHGSNVEITALVTLNTFGSVIANPLGGGTDCGYTLTPFATSTGYNYITDSSCLPGGNAAPASTDRIVAGGNPQLGSLGNNGGATQTLLPASTSPLIDAIATSACQTPPLANGVTTDQRGVSRPQGAGCDIGAVEVQAVVPLVVTPRFTG